MIHDPTEMARGELIQEVGRLRDELTPLRAFADAVLDHFGGEEHMELDYSDALDLLEEAGLIEWYEYDPADDPEELVEAQKGDRVWRSTRRAE